MFLNPHGRLPSGTYELRFLLDQQRGAEQRTDFDKNTTLRRATAKTNQRHHKRAKRNRIPIQRRRMTSRESARNPVAESSLYLGKVRPTFQRFSEWNFPAESRARRERNGENSKESKSWGNTMAESCGEQQEKQRASNILKEKFTPQ
ncbi:hypothetical protein RUM44_010256 [Polyplax serrata]|uniref:Uncharacterized protein n=1 Tax=Polyplax serrata TaxID=468196 RepID=A0ABR1AV13_POLSC